jgi:hypothetical protein
MFRCDSWRSVMPRFSTSLSVFSDSITINTTSMNRESRGVMLMGVTGGRSKMM